MINLAVASGHDHVIMFVLEELVAEYLKENKTQADGFIDEFNRLDVFAWTSMTGNESLMLRFMVWC